MSVGQFVNVGGSLTRRTVLSRPVTTDAGGDGSVTFGNLPKGTKFIAALIRAAAAAVPLGAVPSQNGVDLTGGVQRNDAGGAMLVNDWGEYFYDVPQTGNVVITLTGGPITTALNVELAVQWPELACVSTATSSPCI